MPRWPFLASLAGFTSTHPADVTRIRQIEQWLPEALQYYQASPYRS